MRTVETGSGELVKKKTYQCSDCSFSTPIYSVFHRHVKRHGQDAYVCLQCGNRFKTESMVKSHYKSNHPDKEASYKFVSKDDPNPDIEVADEPKNMSQSEDADDLEFVESKPKKPIEPSLLIDEEFDELPDLENPSTEGVKDFVLPSSASNTPVKAEPKIDPNEPRYACVQCSFNGDFPTVEEHIRSYHKSTPFYVRKSHKGKLFVETYVLGCGYCDADLDTAMEAYDHWMKFHIIKEIKFVMKITKSVDAGADESYEAPDSKPQQNDNKKEKKTTPVDTATSQKTAEDFYESDSSCSSRVSRSSVGKAPPRKKIRLQRSPTKKSKSAPQAHVCQHCSDVLDSEDSMQEHHSLFHPYLPYSAMLETDWLRLKFGPSSDSLESAGKSQGRLKATARKSFTSTDDIPLALRRRAKKTAPRHTARKSSRSGLAQRGSRSVVEQGEARGVWLSDGRKVTAEMLESMQPRVVLTDVM